MKPAIEKCGFGFITVDGVRFEHVFEEGARKLVLGSGHEGMLTLSREAEEFFAAKRCAVVILPTPDAVRAWNGSEERTIGLFHVTC